MRRKWVILFSILLTLVYQGAAAEGAEPATFDLREYRVLALQGEASLQPDVRYVSFTGDFGFREWIPGQDFVREHASRESLLLANFDLNVINLEFMLPGIVGSVDGQTIDGITLEYLKMAGFDLVARGNNHAMDYGDEGVRYNTQRLEEAGFATIGVRSHPLYVWEIDGKKIAIYAMARGTDEPDPNRHVLTIDEADLAWIRDETLSADFRIAFVHLGSMSTFLSPHERQQAQRIIEAGADLVVCTGSHFIKGVVREGEVSVAYGIGNYLLSWADEVTEPTGMHLVAGLREGELVQLLVIPFTNDALGEVVGPMNTRDLPRFIASLQERSVLDTERYYSDPHALKSFKKAIFRPQSWHLQRIRPRHFVYAVRIMLQNYPVVTILGMLVGATLACGALRLFLRRRRTAAI